jgi:peptidoglycan/LPS O-acetylase OafA/YrhL
MMTKGDVDGITVWGRPFKPVALGLTLTMLVVAQANLRGYDRGTEPPLAYVVAFLAGAAIVCMVYGWIGRSQRAAEAGFLLVVAAYTTRAAFIQMSNPWDAAVWFSLASVIIAGGAYMLEATDRGRRE